ncbi:enoyl-CoA hydratase-related protein [Evtepia sp.]|uniref:enoyl-CoA hydratase-related protein n=1 Tax=Evtepia sp. TaxID=2773933 RepID=UPI002A7F7E56|nr:enoyl-CoA hydratase-related protein [Evtepia sp.]MDY3993263.1 enoyl-CoA hydratase-related protein [Evtepia sp.]MDY4429951.1 enoyl-CoA hydratase-related protein [Evtepia sp.]
MALVEVTKQGNVGIVTMNRPEALNALSSAVFADLTAALDQVEQDDDVYVVIITGAGRAFVAGADIGEMANMNVEEGLAFSELGNSLLMRVDMFPKPTIAAVNGFALGGGCELSLACDIRIASEKAKFGQPEVGLGIIPGFGGTQRMARIIGTGAAMELIYTAETIDAKRAEAIGMVNHVVAPDELMDFALNLANKIAANAQVAIRTSKMAIRRGIDCDISTAVTYEALAFATCFGTEDQKDAMKAFVEKRKLNGFKNR